MLKISEAEYVVIKAAIKSNKNKRVAKRLEVLELRYTMKSNAEIAKKTGFNERYITTLIQTSRVPAEYSLRRLYKCKHIRPL